MGNFTLARNAYELQVLQDSSSTAKNTASIASAVQYQLDQANSRLGELITGQVETNALLRNIDYTMGSLLTVVADGFADVAYQMHLQSEQLQQIIALLEQPLDVKAKELRRRAAEAYRQGWFEEAEADFRRSKAFNQYDFVVHQALGNLAFRRQDLEAAVDSYGLAAKYAKPYSTIDAGYALVSLSGVHEAAGDQERARAAAEEAVMLTPPVLPEALYAYGKYSYLTGQDEAACADFLVRSFWAKPALTQIIACDGLLKDRPIALSTVTRYRDELRQLVERRLGSLARAAAYAEDSQLQYPKKKVAAAIEETEKVEPRVRRLVEAGSIEDLLAARALIADATRNYFATLLNSAQTARDRAESKAAEARAEAHDASDETFSQGKWWALGAAVVAGFFTMQAHAGFGVLMVVVVVAAFAGYWGNALVSGMQRQHDDRKDEIGHWRQLVQDLTDEKAKRRWVDEDTYMPKPKRAEAAELSA